MNKDYTPVDLPDIFNQFNETPVQLDVGMTGKVGILDVLLEYKNNKTIITKSYNKVPLQVQKALYLEPTLPQMAYIYVLSQSGGLIQGDRYKTNLILKKKAIAHITTQGATRVYSMNTNMATQVLNITLSQESYLEYIPDHIIPYKDSRYYQKVNLNINTDATLIYSEVITPGRSGEIFDYDICFLKTHCKDQSNNFRFIESMQILPKDNKISDMGVLEKYTVIGTVYVISQKKHTIKIQSMINDIFQKNNLIGISILADGSSLVIRILSCYIEEVFNIIYKIVEICRKQILCAKLNTIRKS